MEEIKKEIEQGAIKGTASIVGGITGKCLDAFTGNFGIFSAIGQHIPEACEMVALGYKKIKKSIGNKNKKTENKQIENKESADG